MNDDNEGFSWRDAVVVLHQDAVAIYSNPHGDLVIGRHQT
jgi:hypothetical protein